MLDDAMASWRNTIADLHEKTQSKVWAGARLRDWTLVDRIFGVQFDKQALIRSNDIQFHSQLHDALTRTSFDLLRIASHCKHEAFQQEAEWRLSLPHTKGVPMKNEEILYRGPNSTIPYLAHNLFSQRLPLIRVKVGPLNENTDTVKEALHTYGYDIPVAKSAVPLRAATSIK